MCKSEETHILCSRTCKNPNEHCVTYSNLTLPKNFGAFVTKKSTSKHESEWKGIAPLQLDLRPVSGLSVSVLHDEFCKHDVVKDWICGSSSNDVENDVPCKEFNGMYFPPSKAASQIQAYEEIEMRTGCGIGYVDGVPQSPPHDSGKITPFKAEGFPSLQTNIDLPIVSFVTLSYQKLLADGRPPILLPLHSAFSRKI